MFRMNIPCAHLFRKSVAAATLCIGLVLTTAPSTSFAATGSTMSVATRSALFAATRSTSVKKVPTKKKSAKPTSTVVVSILPPGTARVDPVKVPATVAGAPETGSTEVASGSQKTNGVAGEYTSSIRTLTDKEKLRMTPSTWRDGCPVALQDLRVVTVRVIGYDGKVADGTIVVHADVAEDVASIFGSIFASGFPVGKMKPIEAYGGSDDRSIDDDNSSAFNCRAVTGGSKFSEHAYGTAIDLNPFRNPYVNNGKAQDRPGAKKYLDRDPAAKLTGVIYPDGPVVKAFASKGWVWGGTWSNLKDYQHFSRSGH